MAEATHLERIPPGSPSGHLQVLSGHGGFHLQRGAGLRPPRPAEPDEGMRRSWGIFVALTWFWPLKIRIYLIYWYLLIFIEDIWWAKLGETMLEHGFTAGHVQSISSHGEMHSFWSGHVHHTSCNSPGCLRVARSKGEVFSKVDLASTMDHSNPPNM